MARKTTKKTDDNGNPAAAASPWAALGLNAELLKTVAQAGFEQPTEIQEALIPPALKGLDCLGQAKTGTGKTAAFALPILQRLQRGVDGQAIVLVPTRELAVQVDEHIRMLGRITGARTALVYGGKSLREQSQQLKQGVDFVVGTPGRVLDLMGRKLLDLGQIRFVVLDEVDRMLDIGFRDDIRKILRSIKTEHQTLFVSATVDDEIRKLAKTFMREPVELNVSRDTLTVEHIEQGFVSLAPQDKLPTLLNYLRQENPKLAIVFTNMKVSARKISRQLKEGGVNCKEIHGDLMQSRRERVMQSFRKAHIQVLVATDLASRGLDVMDVSHIIVYDVPEEAASYVHRIGRTARAGQHGKAVMFVEPDEGGFLTEIEKLINLQIPQLDGDWVVRTHAPPAKVAPPVERDNGAEKILARRYHDIRRCEVLDAYGISPVRRTLGSRFRSSRRRR